MLNVRKSLGKKLSLKIRKLHSRRSHIFFFTRKIRLQEKLMPNGNQRCFYVIQERDLSLAALKRIQNMR